MSQGSPYGSSPNPFGNQNPYSAPQGGWGAPQGQWGQPSGYTPDVPAFCKVMFIVSLVFCFLRAIIVALGFVGMGMLPKDDPAMKMAFFEIGSGLGMVLCGVPGNALLLAQKSDRSLPRLGAGCLHHRLDSDWAHHCHHHKRPTGSDGSASASWR